MLRVNLYPLHPLKEQYWSTSQIWCKDGRQTNLSLRYANFSYFLLWFYLTSGVKAGAMLTCNSKSEWVQDIICLIDLFNEGGREGGQSLADSPPPPGLCPPLAWPQLKVITPTFVSAVSLNSAAIFFFSKHHTKCFRVQVNRFSAQNNLWSSLYYRRVIKNVTLHANCFLGPSCVNSRVWANTFCCPPLLGVVYRSRSQWSYRMCGWLE